MVNKGMIKDILFHLNQPDIEDLITRSLDPDPEKRAKIEEL
jgi:hypothetical protein